MMTTLNNKDIHISDLVLLQCMKVGSNLRVRIVTSGYNKEANCQFPRNIRKVGAKYEVSRYSITLAKGPRGKFFYRINKNNIKVLTEDIKLNIKIYGEDDTKECVVCFEEEKTIVLVPCGHYCLCKMCADTINSHSGECPMCRGKITMVVTKDQIG